LFAVTGAGQLFALHRGRKDHSYSPPLHNKLVPVLGDRAPRVADPYSVL
jgi:hypothetical protein